MIPTPKQKRDAQRQIEELVTYDNASVLVEFLTPTQVVQLAADYNEGKER